MVYGHTPVPEAVWLNRTICIDTGCVFGGRLTALRYPERELVSVPANRVYYEPARPLSPSPPDNVREPTDLDITDVLGKRIVETRLAGAVTVREENAIAALEVMSRFAVDPRWLVYLPPTMSPTATSEREGLLEHPREAFSAFRAAGVRRVVCEEKHMGSRAIVVACRDASVGPRRFGVEAPSTGAIFTRTGRPFFADAEIQAAFLAKVRAGLDEAGLWEELTSDWLALDCELLPWSAKAEDLLRQQYAAVGAAASRSVRAEGMVVQAAASRGVDVTDLAAATDQRAAMVDGFVAAYGHYCWPVRSIDDLELAPFQILAGEGSVHALRGHSWHLERLRRLVDTDPATFRATRAVTVEVEDRTSCDAAAEWWEEMTSRGGERFVAGEPLYRVHECVFGILALESEPVDPRL